MILQFNWLNRAVIAVWVVTALFLMSCRTIGPEKSLPKKDVVTEASASSLHRTANTYYEKERYKEALGLFEEISQNYPYYGGLPTVQYQIASVHKYLGKYALSRDDAYKWLKKYPRHPLRGDVLILLGENFKALGDGPRAFAYWLKGKDECPGDLKRLAYLEKKMEDLLMASDLEAFQGISGYSDLDDYAPRVYHEMAAIFLKNNEPEKATMVSSWLVQSTSEPSWHLTGKDLLERIEDEKDVRPGAIGCLLPLSGPFAIYGEEVLNGIQLGMAMFEETGGGPEIELLIRDTEGEPEKAVAALEDLVSNEKVIAVVGPLLSRTVVPAARRAQQLGVPMITITQKEGITEEGDMIFRNFLTPSREVRSLVQAAMFEMKKNRFAILYPDNSYGRYFMNLFWDTLDEMGGTVAAVESYSPNDTDFPDEIKKMVGLYYPRPASLVKKLEEVRTLEEEEGEIYSDEPEPIIDFDVVFIPDNFQRVAMIAPQLAYYDVSGVQLLGTSLWQSPQLLETARDYVQGAVFPSGFFEGSGEPGVELFVKKYRMNYESSPGILAAAGYDTIRLLKYVMVYEDVRTRTGVQRGLLRCMDFAGVTGMIFFNSHGDLENEPILLTVSGKKMKVFH